MRIHRHVEALITNVDCTHAELLPKKSAPMTKGKQIIVAHKMDK